MEWWLVALGLFLGITWMGVVFVGSPFVPTLQRDLDQLFRDLQLSKDAHLVDLGAGNGKVLRMAALAGAQATGVELNPFLVWIARWRLRKFHDVRIVLGDMWRFPLPSGTTHVFVFLNGKFMSKLVKKLRNFSGKERLTVISYGFAISDLRLKKSIGAFNLYQL